MQINTLHSWDVSPVEAVRLQKDLANRIRLETFDAEVHHVAGADVSYNIGSDQFYAGVVVLTFPQLQLVEESVAVRKVAPFPYIPGLLSFREAPILLEAFQQVTSSPDVVIFDGQGIAHPQRMGIASHMGLFLDCPSIGCAKSKLTGVYAEHTLGEQAGASIPLRSGDDGTIIGAVVRTKNHTKPVFVSPGYKIDIPSSVELVLKCCRGYKLPEPTRLAHHCVNRVRRQFL